MSTRKGRAGDATLLRSQRDGLICLCRWQYQEPFGLHSGLAKIVPLTERGTDGPVECWRVDRVESGRCYLVGISTPPGGEP